MSNWHGYIGIENVGLNDTQRDTFIDALKELGPDSHPSPACLCHWRTRIDGQAAIFEAMFNEDNLTVQSFKDKLGNIFEIDPETITHSTEQTQYGPVVTFTYTVDRLKLLVFGGTDATWMESGDACRAFLAANIAEWDTDSGT